MWDNILELNRPQMTIKSAHPFCVLDGKGCRHTPRTC